MLKNQLPLVATKDPRRSLRCGFQAEDKEPDMLPPAPCHEEISLPARPSRSRRQASSDHYRVDGREALRQIPRTENRLRVALYSHDTMGLGHLRRNMLIAQALASAPIAATNLLITGAHEANFFSLPKGVDCLTLPRIQKNGAGEYSVGQLDISVDRLTRMRGMSIRSALEHFQPDLLIVDKVPQGAFNELVPVLKMLRQDPGARCVLGIRDVLDDAATVRREWQQAAHEGAIARFYDEIWVYGDPRVYDPAREYRWCPAVTGKVRFTGYLDQSVRQVVEAEAPLSGSSRSDAATLASFIGQGNPNMGNPNMPLVVCTLGGGQDGYPVARAFLDSLAGQNMLGLLLTGPFMPAESLARLQARAAGLKNAQVVKFTDQADRLLGSADRVIAMAGYNTVCEILSYGKPALLVPRVTPRQEQLIRTRRLCELGLVDMLHPQDLSAAAIRRWLVQTPAPREEPRHRLDLNGLERIQEYAANLTRKQSTHPFDTIRP
jgi:predicted glycosyltransferase